MDELPPSTNPTLSNEDTEIINFLSKTQKDIREEKEEKKPIPPRPENPTPYKQPKQLSCSRVSRFKDWCEYAGMPNEDIEEYAQKLKMYLNEHDEDSEQEEHESYEEELEDIKEEMFNEAMDKFEEMDDEYEQELTEKYQRRRGFPPYNPNQPQEYSYPSQQRQQFTKQEQFEELYD